MNGEQRFSEGAISPHPTFPQTPQTPATPRYSPRPAFQRKDFSRVSIGRGRARNSFRQLRPGAGVTGPRPGVPSGLTSAPGSPGLRPVRPARPSSVSDFSSSALSPPPESAPVSESPPAFVKRQRAPGSRTGERPVSYPGPGTRLQGQRRVSRMLKYHLTAKT